MVSLNTYTGDTSGFWTSILPVLTVMDTYSQPDRVGETKSERQKDREMKSKTERERETETEKDKRHKKKKKRW